MSSSSLKLEIPPDASLHFGDRLGHFLKRDTWETWQGVYLLAGLLPEIYEMLGSKLIYRLDGVPLVSECDIQESAKLIWDIRDTFESNPSHTGNETPRYWLKWAESKDIQITWLAWAAHRGLLPANEGEDQLGKALPDTPLIADESPSARRLRFGLFINQRQASGATITEAMKELAAIEGCGLENIRRIHYKKKK